MSHLYINIQAHDFKELMFIFYFSLQALKTDGRTIIRRKLK